MQKGQNNEVGVVKTPIHSALHNYRVYLPRNPTYTWNKVHKIIINLPDYVDVSAMMITTPIVITCNNLNEYGWAKDDYMDVGGRLCLEQKVEGRRAQHFVACWARG